MLSKILFSAIFAIFAVPSASLQAAPLYDPTVATCTTTNCGSIKLGGTVLGFDQTSGASWLEQIYASRDECLRIQVVDGNSTIKLHMTVVAPNGTVWRNNQNGVVVFPIVKINGTPVAGWYSVAIGKFTGLGVDTDFQFSFGRYNKNNANCKPATPTLGPAAPVPP